jgi:hypothetical protein
MCFGGFACKNLPTREFKPDSIAVTINCRFLTDTVEKALFVWPTNQIWLTNQIFQDR